MSKKPPIFDYNREIDQDPISKIVLVEGLDNAGKSELVDFYIRDQKQYFVPQFFKFTRSYKSINTKERYFVDRYFDVKLDFGKAFMHDGPYIFDFLMQVPCNVIFDRSFLTEFAYGKTHIIFDDYVKKLADFGAKLIYCSHPNPKLDPDVDEDLRNKAAERYELFLEKCPIKWICIDARVPLINRAAEMRNFITKEI